MATLDIQAKVKRIVSDYFNSRADASDGTTIGTDDIFVVWQCKTLQNWKAMASTTVPDGMYYEVTFNGNTGETYLDVYRKWENVCLPAPIASVN